MFNKLRKIIIAASCAAYLVLGTTAFAADMPESDININDIIEGEEGEEVVISILDDGRFVTTPLTVQSYAACDHTIIVGTGTMHIVINIVTMRTQGVLNVEKRDIKFMIKHGQM